MLLSFLKTILLPFIEQVRFGAAQVDNLWTAISLQTKRDYSI